MTWCVAPPAGAWIETGNLYRFGRVRMVAPPAGAWIETLSVKRSSLFKMSRPPRARGLKLQRQRDGILPKFVAPPAGAWIETDSIPARDCAFLVAPPAGAWIETAHKLLWRAIRRRAPRGRVD